MRKLKVNLEKTATRCEICHQEDLYDGFSGTCQRCKDLSLIAVSQSKVQAVDGKKETLAAKEQTSCFSSHFLSYNLSEIIFFSFMIPAIVLLVFFPESVKEIKQTIRSWGFCVGIIMAVYNFLFDRVEGQARTMRIAGMMVVFSLWEFFVRFFTGN